MVLWSSYTAEDYLKKLKAVLDKPSSDAQLYRAIVNAPFNDKAVAGSIGLGIVVLLLVNKDDMTIDRVALSDTELAKGTVSVSVKPFRAIKIPLNNHENYIAEAIRSGSYQVTCDWKYLFTPELDPEEARLNQAGGGIACSFIYPLKARQGGALIFSYYKTLDQIQQEHRDFMFHYAKLVSQQLKVRSG